MHKKTGTSTRVWLLLASFLLLAGPCWSMTVYVDAANSSGIEDGTIANPFNTIQEGIHAAPLSYSWGANGWEHTVSVAPGIYYGTLELKQGVKLVSQQGPERTIIDAAGAFTAIWAPFGEMPWIDMHGFTVRNANRMLIYAVRRAVWANPWAANNCVIDNCILEDSPAYGIFSDNQFVLKVSNTVIRNVQNAIHAYNAWLPVFNNLTIDKVSTAFYMVSTNGTVTINNTSISNAATPIYVHTPKLWNYYPTRLLGSNNNFFNVGQPYVRWYSASQIPVDELQATLSVDPLYVDTLKKDYHLKPASPLIDAGSVVGKPYIGNAPDIGAYEYDSRTVGEMFEDMSESFQEIPIAEFKNSGERRRDAFYQKLDAVQHKLAGIVADTTPAEKAAIYADCLDKLTGDILPKVDGYYGGNSNNDWITTVEEQNILYPQISALIDAINAEAGN